MGARRETRAEQGLYIRGRGRRGLGDLIRMRGDNDRFLRGGLFGRDELRLAFVEEPREEGEPHGRGHGEGPEDRAGDERVRGPEQDEERGDEIEHDVQDDERPNDPGEPLHSDGAPAILHRMAGAEAQEDHILEPRGQVRGDDEEDEQDLWVLERVEATKARGVEWRGRGVVRATVEQDLPRGGAQQVGTAGV